MKLVAIVTMVADHVGMIFFPQVEALRIVGRLSMPLFAYLVAVGIERTRDRSTYLCRLFTLFVFSQLPYGLFVGAKLNVFLSLAVGGMAASFLADRKPGWALALLAAFLGFTLQQPVSYGQVGPALVLAFAVLPGRPVASTLLVAAVFATHGLLTGSHFSRIAIPVLPFVPLVVQYVHWRSPSRWRWAYWTYPFHLAFFYGVAWHLGITQYIQR